MDTEHEMIDVGCVIIASLEFTSTLYRVRKINPFVQCEIVSVFVRV